MLTRYVANPLNTLNSPERATDRCEMPEARSWKPGTAEGAKAVAEATAARATQARSIPSLEWCQISGALYCYIKRACPSRSGPARVTSFLQMEFLAGLCSVLAQRYVAACEGHIARSNTIQNGEFSLSSNSSERSLATDDIIVVQDPDWSQGSMVPSGRERGGLPQFIYGKIFHWILKLGAVGIGAMIRYCPE